VSPGDNVCSSARRRVQEPALLLMAGVRPIQRQNRGRACTRRGPAATAAPSR